MTDANEKEITGAWVIHHGRKLNLDANGSAEFPAIDEAAKAATLLSKLGQTNEVIIPITEVRAIAVASGLNPRHALNGLLQVLQKKRLIDQSENEIALLGITTRGTLGHAAEFYYESDPNQFENASIALAEMASKVPMRKDDICEKIGDYHKLSRIETTDLLNRAEEIGFVDREGEGQDALIFNGNLFRRGSVAKTERVLSSLSESDQVRVRNVAELLERSGCVLLDQVEKLLTKQLFEKLVAAGAYDLNQVMNEQGSHVFVTAPSAFHKFVDPMVDDCFDMAKSLVAALSYGMNSRHYGQGRIAQLPALLARLISGSEIGPATAIGQDYRVLEVNRVIKLRPDVAFPRRFHMKLLKLEVGQLALHVLTSGNADASSLIDLPSAPMSGYKGPEESRVAVRKKQNSLSKKTTRDILEAVRGGRSIP